MTKPYFFLNKKVCIHLKKKEMKKVNTLKNKYKKATN